MTDDSTGPEFDLDDVPGTCLDAPVTHETCPDCGEDLVPGDKTSCCTQTPLNRDLSRAVSVAERSVKLATDLSRRMKQLEKLAAQWEGEARAVHVEHLQFGDPLRIAQEMKQVTLRVCVAQLRALLK